MATKGEVKTDLPSGSETPASKESAAKTPDLPKIWEEAATLPNKQKRSFVANMREGLEAKKTELSESLRKKLWPPDGNGTFNAGTTLALYGKRTQETFQTAKIVNKKGEIEEPEEQDEDTPSHSETIPDRKPGCKTGSQLFKEWGLNRDMNTMQPELIQRAIAEIRKGNVPDFVREQRNIPLGQGLSFTTSKDYFAVGTNDNYMYFPISGMMGKAIADELGWHLPTSTMALAAENSADYKIVVGGHNDLAHMSDLRVAKEHNDKILKLKKHKLAEYNAKHPSNPLTFEEFSRRFSFSGHKKVVCAGENSTKGGVLILGLREANGGFTQAAKYPHSSPSLPGFHGDYSQAGQFVYNLTAQENGKTKTISYNEAMQNPKYARIINAHEAKLYRNDGTFDPRLSYETPRNQRRIASNQRPSTDRPA